MPPLAPVLFRQEAAEDVFDIEYKKEFIKGLKKALWKKYYKPVLEGCKPADLKTWFEDKDPGGSGAATLVKNWAAHAKPGFETKVPVLAAHSEYYNLLSDGFAAEEAYYDALADFEYDEVIEDARESRELKRLQRQKVNVLRLKKAMNNAPRKRHRYPRYN
eukprot:UN07268